MDAGLSGTDNEASSMRDMLNARTECRMMSWVSVGNE